jgi:hypothetical protein
MTIDIYILLVLFITLILVLDESNFLNNLLTKIKKKLKINSKKRQKNSKKHKSKQGQTQISNKSQ